MNSIRVENSTFQKLQGRRCALFIAHPGHELRIHGWLEAAKPTVYVLTDGSGREGQSRLASTTRLLARAGAQPGSLYGRYPDRAIYDAILRRDVVLFRGLVSELADELLRGKFDFVLGDAEEGAILTHDFWRGMVNAAIASAQARQKRPIANYQFDLEAPPQQAPVQADSNSIRLELDDGALARKIAAARSYPELRSEVEAAFRAYGTDAFRIECLQQVRLVEDELFSPAPRDILPFPSRPDEPHYERHGSALVAAGIYPAVVRYEQHVAPHLSELTMHKRAA